MDRVECDVPGSEPAAACETGAGLEDEVVILRALAYAAIGRPVQPIGGGSLRARASRLRYPRSGERIVPKDKFGLRPFR